VSTLRFLGMAVLLVVGAVACLPFSAAGASAPISTGAAAQAGARSPRPSLMNAVAPTGVHVLGWGFSNPDVMAVSGNELFVSNGGDNSVTEVDTSTGALVRVMSGSSLDHSSRPPPALSAVTRCRW
jgi:hypothetical protein